MEVRQLRSTIDDIAALLSAAGASAQEKDVQKLIAYLAENANRSVDELADVIKLKLSNPGSGDVDRLSGRIIDAGLDEVKFNDAMEDLSAIEKTLSKQMAIEIARRVGTARIDERSKLRVIESIKRHFYATLNDHLANQVAARTTSW